MDPEKAVFPTYKLQELMRLLFPDVNIAFHQADQDCIAIELLFDFLSEWWIGSESQMGVNEVSEEVSHCARYFRITWSRPHHLILASTPCGYAPWSYLVRIKWLSWLAHKDSTMHIGQRDTPHMVITVLSRWMRVSGIQKRVTRSLF